MMSQRFQIPIIGFLSFCSLASAQFGPPPELSETLVWDAGEYISDTGAHWLTVQFPTLRGAAYTCLLYTSPSPRDQRGSRMPSSA